MSGECPKAVFNALQTSFKKVARRLVFEGISVHYVQNREYGFITAKLDYGVCRSISFNLFDYPAGVGEVSHHCRYNIGAYDRCQTSDKEGRPVFFFPVGDEDALIERILRDRNDLYLSRGIMGYKMSVDRYRGYAGDGSKPFWNVAKEFRGDV